MTRRSTQDRTPARGRAPSAEPVGRSGGCTWRARPGWRGLDGSPRRGHGRFAGSAARHGRLESGCQRGTPSTHERSRHRMAWARLGHPSVDAEGPGSRCRHAFSHSQKRGLRNGEELGEGALSGAPAADANPPANPRSTAFDGLPLWRAFDVWGSGSAVSASRPQHRGQRDGFMLNRAGASRRQTTKTQSRRR